MSVPASDTLAKPCRFAELVPFSGSNLPIELVLRILDLLASSTRDSNRVYAHSLSLISRAVRNSILPILYEGLIIQIDSYGPDYVGWDGRTYEHPAIACLAWLLYNPSATPRRHIKCISFKHGFSFQAKELTDWAVDSEPRAVIDGCLHPRWIVKDLIIADISDGRTLLKAGISARIIHRLWPFTLPNSPQTLGDVSRYVLHHGARLLNRGPLTRNCIRIWTRHTQSQKPRMHWKGTLIYQELDPVNLRVGGRAVPQDQLGVAVFFELGLQDGFGWLSRRIVESIVKIFKGDAKGLYRVVLVLPSNAHVKELQGAVCVLMKEVRLSAFHRHVSVVRSPFPDRRLLREDPQRAFARALLQGINPWDTGCRLSDLQ